MDYHPIHNQSITTADGRKLKVVRMGNVIIKLPNGAKCTKIILKDAIYAPDMAFTLISTDDLDDAKCSVIFSKGMCTIKDPKAHTMATVP